MYEEHFGLTRPPFRTNATGQDVFLGPQTANTIKAIRKALGTQDAVVTVSGPVGVGKTAIVGRSLDALGGKQTRIRIGRMAIAHDEILDFLLEVLGVTSAPASTIRRIALFRSILMQKRQEDERVFVIVEDGARLGEDPLAELEALTAADGGAGGGAALIVIGDPALETALDKPSLARLNQRVRLRHKLQSLSEGELAGYLKHCFRSSGGDFDELFEAGAPELLHKLSDGIPRVCNNLVEASLAAAAEQGHTTLSLDQLRRIAKDEFSLTTESTSDDVSQLAEALVVPSATDAEESQPDIDVSQSMSAPMPDFAAEMNAAEAEPDDDIPELINDTIPELTALPESLAEQAAADSEEASEEDSVQNEAEAEEFPAELSLEIPTDDESEAAAADVPDWEKDPTLAELKPDIEALESAMAESTNAANDAPKPEATAEPDVEISLKDPSVPAIPELKLEESIQQTIDEATAALDTQEPADAADGSDSDEPALSTPDEQAEKADGELEKIARGLARAKTLDDVDDQMAETLFGEEFSMMAAQVAASVADMDLDEEEPPKESARPAVAETAAAATTMSSSAAKPAAAPAAKTQSIDSSPSARLRTVQALNAGKAAAPAARPTTPPAGDPADIENQFADIAATPKQPQQAREVDDDDGDDDDTGKKSGFFSRFKRS